jgi:hypothetical protein
VLRRSVESSLIAAVYLVAIQILSILQGSSSKYLAGCRIVVDAMRDGRTEMARAATTALLHRSMCRCAVSSLSCVAFAPRRAGEQIGGIKLSVTDSPKLVSTSVQSLFFVAAGWVAILSYRTPKRTLFQPLRTEIFKSKSRAWA